MNKSQRLGEMMKKSVVEGEVIEESHNQSLNLEEINQKINEIQTREHEDDSLLENFNINQLNEEMQELFKKSQEIMNSSSAQSGDDNWGIKMLKMIPYGDKLVAKGREKVFEHSSFKTVIDEFSERADKIRLDAAQNSKLLHKQCEGFEKDIEDSETILELIDKAIINLKREDASRKEKRELGQWQIARANLAGLIQSNKMSLNSLEKILQTTQALEMRTAQFNPIIKKFIKQHSKMATQNVRNQLINETQKTGIALLNELQKQVQSDTHKIIKEGMHIMSSPIVAPETLETMRKEHISFYKDVQKINQEITQNMISYNKQLEKNNIALENHTADNHLSLTFDDSVEKEEA